MVIKRRIIIGGYDTAEHGWTLSACKLTKGQQVQNFVSVPGRYAPLDFSTYLTDGQPYYGNAKLDVTLECSEGTRDQRLARIELMANMLDGRTWQILHPDHPGRYLVGRVQVSALDYNDNAHCAVKLSAVCEPWLYNAAETAVPVTLPANTAASKNLLDLSRATLIGCTSNATTQTVTCNIQRSYYSIIRVAYLNDLLMSNLGKPFTFSIKSALPGAAVSIVIYGTRTNGQEYQEVTSHLGQRTITITIAEDFTDIRLFEVRINRQWSKFSDDRSQVSELQVEAGTDATAFEPYHAEGELPIKLTNSGRLAVTPTLHTTGTVTVKQGENSQALSAGTWVIPWLHIVPAESFNETASHWLTCSGSGTVEFVYREAVLAV